MCVYYNWYTNGIRLISIVDDNQISIETEYGKNLFDKSDAISILSAGYHIFLGYL